MAKAMLWEVRGDMAEQSHVPNVAQLRFCGHGKYGIKNRAYSLWEYALS